MARIDPKKRARALQLLSNGQINQGEAAAMLRCTRQAVHDMCAREKIDPVLARWHYLQQMFGFEEVPQW